MSDWISGEGEGDGSEGVQAGCGERPRGLPDGPGRPGTLHSNTRLCAAASAQHLELDRSMGQRFHNSTEMDEIDTCTLPYNILNVLARIIPTYDTLICNDRKKNS